MNLAMAIIQPKSKVESRKGHKNKEFNEVKVVKIRN